VTTVRWNDAGVTLAMTNGDELHADRCICSVPISPLQRAEPLLDPGLPAGHRTALSRIGMGVVDKVLLRFDERWWPVPPEGYFRWYDTPSSWCEWLDLTDGCRAPVVAGLIAHDAVARHHRGRTDAEVAAAATLALRAWASAVWERT
jgi:monoamine oxidase